MSLSAQGLGRVGILIPAAFYSAEGSKGLRRMVLETAQIEHMYAFENSFKIFPIHSSFKFIAFVLSNVAADDEREFPAAFMLRRADWLDASASQQASRVVTLSPKFIREQSPSHLSFFEFRSEQEKALVQRIYEEFPPLGRQIDDTWNVSFTRELDMSNDSWLFRERDRLLEFGGTQHTGEYWTLPDKEWFEGQPEKFVWVSRTESELRGKPKPKGKKAASDQTFEGFVLMTEDDERSPQIMVPGSKYVPLYEGRMVHQFDHAAKAYVRGSGRRAEWRDLGWDEKEIVPHFFVSFDSYNDLLPGFSRVKAGYCRVTGQTNERTLMASLLPAEAAIGEAVPGMKAAPDDLATHLYVLAFFNSLPLDWLIRLKVAMNISLHMAYGLPLPRPPVAETEDAISSLARGLSGASAPFDKLFATERDERSLSCRASSRATLDAQITHAFGLTAHELASLLTTFPLLDRDQPWLPGDGFIAYDKKGRPKFKPRSFVTRDKVLLQYFRLLGQTPPDNIVVFFAEAGVDIDGGKVLGGEPPADPFNPPICATGPIRNLEKRVRLAEDELGAVAYVPTVRKKPTEEALARIAALEARLREQIPVGPEGGVRAAAS